MFALKLENEQCSFIERPETLQLPVKTGLTWLHFEGDMEAAQQWLSRDAELDTGSIDALCDELTRPRLFVNASDELVVIVRALSCLEEDCMNMVSVRAWITGNMLVTLSRGKTPAICQLSERLAQRARGVHSPLQLFWQLSDLMSEQITSYIAELDEKLIGFEDAWESQRQSEQDKLNSFRFAMSRMRRYLSPQLETFEKIAALADIGLVHKKEQRSYQARWRDCANSVKRDIEALAEMRERVVILRDAWQQHTNEKSNQVMYLLSVVATFFLPMTFIASLLGMNVDGIPGANHPWAFMVVSSSMIALGILQWVLFRRWQWLK